jgi:hypothetical protein
MVKKRKVESETGPVGLAWYSLDAWQHLKQRAADAHTLHATYLEWLRQAETTLETLRSGGVDIRRVPVTFGELDAWCAERGVPNDSKARSAFAAELARRGVFLPG